MSSGDFIFDIIPSPAKVGETVRFFFGQDNGKADYNIPVPRLIQWSFGDEITSMEPNTAHIYTSPGTYQVWCRAYMTYPGGTENLYMAWENLTVDAAVPAPTPTPPAPTPTPPAPTPTPPAPTPTPPAPTPTPGPGPQANANGLVLAGVIGLGLAALGVHTVRTYKKNKRVKKK